MKFLPRFFHRKTSEDPEAIQAHFRHPELTGSFNNEFSHSPSRYEYTPEMIESLNAFSTVLSQAGESKLQNPQNPELTEAEATQISHAFLSALENGVDAEDLLLTALSENPKLRNFSIRIQNELDLFLRSPELQNHEDEVVRQACQRYRQKWQTPEEILAEEKDEEEKKGKIPDEDNANELILERDPAIFTEFQQALAKIALKHQNSTENDELNKSENYRLTIVVLAMISDGYSLEEIDQAFPKNIRTNLETHLDRLLSSEIALFHFDPQIRTASQEYLAKKLEIN